VFLGTCGRNLLVEIECFSGQVSAHVEQYQVIHIGLPQKSRPAEILGRVHLDAMTLQNSDPHVAGRLVTIDKGCAIGRIVLRKGEGVNRNIKVPAASVASIEWWLPYPNRRRLTQWSLSLSLWCSSDSRE
jgi:hypothetical protein